MKLSRRILLFVFIVLPVLLVAAYSYWHIKKNTIDKIYEERRSLASLSARVLKEKLDRLHDIGLSFSTRPLLCKYVDEQKWDDVNWLIVQVPKDFDYIHRVFITDTAGTLMTDAPSSPELKGISYAQRDWYKGVTKNWQPYLSEVYKQISPPYDNVTAFAVPIKNDAGKIRGILVLQVDIIQLLEWSNKVNSGHSGFEYIVDQKGHIAANPQYEKTDSVIDYSSVPAVQKALSGKKNVEVLYNPIAKENRLSAYEQVPGYGWAVIVQQKATAVLAGNRGLQSLFVFYLIIITAAIISAYFIIREMDRRKKAEVTLRKSEQLIKAIINNTGNPITIKDLSGKFILLNRSAAKIFNHEEKELVGKSPYELLPEESAGWVKETDDAIIRSRSVLETKLSIVQKDGVHYYMNNKFPLIDEQNNVYAVGTVSTDITEIKKAEAELSKLKHELELIFNSVKEGIHGIDKDGNIIFENTAAAHMLGWDINELIGKPAHATMHHSFPNGLPYPQSECNIYATLHDGIVRHIEDEVFWRKDGSSFPVAYTSSPIRNQKGGIIGSIVTFHDIIERKKTEESLKEFKHFFNNSNDLCLIANMQGYFETINPNLEKVLGFSEKELTTKPFIDFVHPDDIPATLQEIEKLKTGALTINFVNRYRKKDGNYLWFDWNTTPDPVTGKLYAIARDITERKMLEEKLKQFNRDLENLVEEKTREVIEKEKQYRFLLQNMREGIQVIGFDWRYLFVNNSVVHQSKYSNEELLGHTMMEKYPGIETTEMFEVLQHCMKERTATIFENEFTFPNGTKEWFELSIQPVPEGLFILSMDITERKKAEEKLVKSEELFSGAFHSSPAGITITRIADGKIIDANESFLKMFEFSREEVIGHTSIELNMLSPVERTKLIQQQIASGGLTNFELLCHSKSGKPINLLFSSKQLNIHDEPCHITTLIEITERKKAEEKLKKYAEDLKNSNTELERFAYVASHDLQEPLRMVSSFLNLLEEELDGKLNETSREYIRFAVDGAGRMKTLVNDLLQYSRVGSNKEVFTVTDLNEIMQYVTRVLEEDIEKSQAIITVSTLPVIMANKTLISQLFMNLVSNALKYHGGEAPKIEVGFSEKLGNYIFYVKDNGLGIDPKYFDKIFIIFQRLHNKTEYSGTGIGLAISKKIVEIHKGKIWVESEEGKGSKFYFSIPKNNHI